MKVLLVEDDVEISDMLKSFLTAEGFEVVAAYDGESACGKFSEGECSGTHSFNGGFVSVCRLVCLSCGNKGFAVGKNNRKIPDSL